MSGLINKVNVMSVGILGSGSAFPAEAGAFFSNEEIHILRYGKNWQEYMKNLNLDPNYHQNEYGFSRRYWVHKPGTINNSIESTSIDLMIDASNFAISAANISKDKIDLIISFTTTSPKYTSSTATAVAGRLGLQCAALEIKSGCSSSIYALIIAYNFLKNGARNVLITGADTISKITDISSSHLYAAGDGGGAIVVGHVDDSTRGLHTSYIDSDGSFSEEMGVPGILPPTHEALENNEYTLFFSDKTESVLKEKWKLIPEILYKKSGFRSHEFNSYIPHQVNKKLIQYGADAAGISKDKTINIVSEIANCGPSSVLIALHHAISTNQIINGSLVMLAAAGGGISWGGLILRI